MKKIPTENCWAASRERKKGNDDIKRNRRRGKMARRRHRRNSAQRILLASCFGIFGSDSLQFNKFIKSKEKKRKDSPNFSKWSNSIVIRICFFLVWKIQDSNNLREALKYSAQLLSELRTSRLSPHRYYELCKVLESISKLLVDRC